MINHDLSLTHIQMHTAMLPAFIAAINVFVVVVAKLSGDVVRWISQSLSKILDN